MKEMTTSSNEAIIDGVNRLETNGAIAAISRGCFKAGSGNGRSVRGIHFICNLHNKAQE